MSITIRGSMVVPTPLTGYRIAAWRVHFTDGNAPGVWHDAVEDVPNAERIGRLIEEGCHIEYAYGIPLEETIDPYGKMEHGWSGIP